MNRSPGKSRSRLHSHTHSDTRAPSLFARVLATALFVLVGAPVLPILVGSISSPGSALFPVSSALFPVSSALFPVSSALFPVSSALFPVSSALAQSATADDAPATSGAAASNTDRAATNTDSDFDLPPIAEAVRGLGDPSFRERETASRALLSHGRAALPALRAALESDDAEVRHRAEDLIDRITRSAAASDRPASGRGSSLEDRLERLRGRVLPLGAGELRLWDSGFGELGFGDERFEESLRRLDELFESLDRVAPPMTESFRSRMELMDRDLDAHIAELHERIRRSFRPLPGGSLPTERRPGRSLEERFFGGDSGGSGRARIQIWRDGAPVFDSSRSYDFADVASLGIAVESVHPSLRAHLPIPAGEGLTVGHVTPESAAARAGLEEHDILLKLNDAPIVSVADLRSRSESREGRQALTLEILRQGSLRTVEISFPGAGGR